MKPNLRRLLMGGVVAAALTGGIFNFLNFDFRTAVPGAQTRPFVQTHVYTGAPKLSLKGDGLVKWNRHNLLARSAYNAADWTTAGTTVALTTAVVGPDGGNGMLLLTATAGASRHYAHTPISTVPVGRSYTHTGYFRKTNSRYVIFGGADHVGTFYCASFDLDTTSVRATNTGVTASIVDTGDGLFRMTVKHAQPANTACAPLCGIDSAVTSLSGGSWTNWTAAGTETVYCGYVMSSYGDEAFEFLGNSSSIAPVLDEPTIFNTSGTRLGIVLEPAATNLNTQSADQTNAAWTKTGVTASAAGVGPYNNTMTTLTEDTATSAHICYSAGWSGTSGTVYTISAWIRKGTRRYVMVGASAAGGTFFVTIDTSNWTISQQATASGLGTATTNSGKLEQFGTDLYRVSVTGSIAVTGSYFSVVGGSDTATPTVLNTTSYLGTSSTIICSDFQSEAGSVATSYIPTTTASVTRTADTCYRIPGPEYQAGQGSLAVDFYRSISPAGNNSGVGFDDGSDNNVIGLGMASGNALAWVRTGGATQANGQQTFSTSTINRLAMSWQTNSVKGAVNGVATTEDTSATIPTVTTLRIAGMGTGGTWPLLPQTLARVQYNSTAWSQATVDSVSNGGSAGSVNLDFNYATGVYTYTPVNAGVTTTYSLSTLISSGLMTLTGTPSAKNVRGPAGTLVEVAAGSLAIEYDVNGNVLGCINTEPARTNSRTFSQDFTNAAYTFLFASCPTTSVVGPDGNTYTTNTLREDGTTDGHNFRSNVTTTAAAWTMSIYAKKAARDRILLYEASSNACRIFNLATGTIEGTAGLSAPTTSTMEALSNGWYRCSITMTPTAASNSFRIYAAINNDNASSAYIYAGNNSDALYMFGLQIEAGSYASSYIPTTSAAVTRNADVWTLNLGSWFDNSKWIVASKVYAPRANMRDGSNAAAALTLFNASESTADYLQVYLDSTNRIDFAERVSSVNGASGFTTSLSYPAVVRSGFGFAPSNAKASVNGSTQTLTGTPSAIQAAFTKAGLGRSFSNPTYGSVYIQSINILPVVPTQDNVNQYAQAA